MSDRTSARADLLTALGAAGLTGTPTVGAWAGEEAAFNPDCVHPSVWVGAPQGYPSAVFGPLLEAAPPGVQSALFDREIRVAVYVATDGDTALDDGQDLLEEIEEALAGRAVTLGGTPCRWYPVPGNPGAEGLLSVIQGVCLQVQHWAVSRLVNY